MIKVKKSDKPEILQSLIVGLATEKMEEFFLSKNRGQKRYKWPFNKEIDSELKKQLHFVFHGKCGYCESEIENSTLGTIDRYRPNNGVRDKNEYFQDLYWWLTFEWDNLIYCCKECNQFKANYFPIDNSRAQDPKDDLSLEGCLLLNPYEDEPAQHLIYQEQGLVFSFTDKGSQTIALLRLNRTDLVLKRKLAQDEILEIVQQIEQGGVSAVENSQISYLQEIFSKTNSPIPFLAFKKSVLAKEVITKHFLVRLLGIQDYVAGSNNLMDLRKNEEIGSGKKDYITSDYFPIEYIHIKNFKSIEDLRIDFKLDDLDKKSWLFLLGENGVGKSSILQAISLGLKLDKKVIVPLVSSLIKKGKQNSEIIIKERNSENILRTKLIRKDSSAIQIGKFDSYLIGYGSLRLSVDEIESDSKNDIMKVSYENLFRPTKALNDVTKWLKYIHKKDIAFFDRIAYSIKQLLPHDNSDLELSVKKNEIILGDSETQFAELSDGYKSTIILAIDIMMKLSDAQSDMDKMSGIVIIDELGNQLHPRWQMRIVKQLRTVFPNINFIVSTHHPLCLRGAEKEEILLLRNIDNEVVASKELPDPATLRVDQILASEFFGLSSLIDPEIEAKFNRYYELLAKNNDILPNDKAELTQLEDFLRNKKQLGGSLREELMYTIIDKLLAEKVNFNKDSFDRNSLKEEAVRRVKEVWKNLNLDNNDWS